MTAQQKLVAEKEAAGPFVINLCSSTTPMALAQPKAPELKRFNFFVSRRRADGRDRFHLHMGHFMSLTEAEEWLNIVREFYPAAWAGDAPGKRLAERAAAAVAPAVQPPPVAAVPAPTPAPAAPVVAAVPVVEAPPKAVAPSPPPLVVPTLHAASRPAAAPVPKISAPPSQPKAAAPASKPAPKRIPPPAPTPAVAANKPATTTNPAPVSKPAAAPGSNVREVLKALDDTGQTRQMPVAAKPAEPASLTDTAVLKILETRRTPGQTRTGDSGTNGIELLKPDDTATVRALKEAIREDAAVFFAVQLQWSVQPIEVAKVPPLAIFSAYTLYTVDGSRDGRKWYGLRLGFFGDAISAKQVASYVRSEFTSVAVIPVSFQERERATGGDPKDSAQASRQRKEIEKPADEFRLLDDRTDDIMSPGIAAAQAQMNPKAAPVKAGAKPVTRKKPFGKVRANEKRSAKSLEETLEILGASELEIDNGRGEFLNDSGVRHLRIEVQKNSPFSKLLERLSERVRKA